MRIVFHKWKYLLSLSMLWTTLISEAQQLTHQMTFNVNDIEITQVNGYDMVRLVNGGFIENEENTGEPQLPLISINLLLPEGAVATAVTVTATQETQITGNFTVYPVQLPAIPDFSDPPPFIDPDPVIYESDNPFPHDLLVDFSTYGYRNYSIAGISFIPFRYLPDSGELYLQTNITISVSYTISLPDHPYKLRPGGTADTMAWEYVAGMIDNYTEMPSFYDEPENDPEYSVLFENIFETTDLPSEQGSRVEYVIITNDTDIYGNPVGNLTDIFQEFADWKNQMGMPARVVTVDLIRASYSGVDVQEKIRKFIQEAHQKWGTEYVLLGGNAELVPVRWVKHGFDMPTDLYYSAIYHPTRGYNDNWNDNGNHLFGQNTSNDASPDFADYMPDIAVGRAPVSTEAEAELFLNKNFIYANSSGAWLGKTLLGYGVTFDRHWDDAINGLRMGFDIIQAHHTNTDIHGMFEFYEDWDEDPINNPKHYSWCPGYYPLHSTCTVNSVAIDDQDLTHPDILSRINQGYNIVNVMDHAGPYSMGIGSFTHLPALTMNDFHNLTNDKYGIFLAGGCHTAAIERNSYIGKSWVNASGGGVSFFGASADIYATPSFAFGREFYKTILTNNIYKQGLISGHTSINSPVNNSYKYYLLKIYQLLGDPELTVFTQAPTPLTVFHPTTITNGNQPFEVTVSGYGPSWARVSVYKEGEVLAVGEVAGTSSSVTLDITPDTTGDLYITVTGRNRITYEADIPVTQISGTHLYIENFTFTDENANGIIEPGEEVDITFTLKNTGATGATGISAVLSTEDINTDITQNTSAYPDIPAGQPGNNTISYTFKASTEPGIRALEFALDITSSQGNFTEPVLLPLSRSQLNISDWSATVNNEETNEFEPYDEIELSVTIHNTGTVDAESVTAVLTTGLPSNILTVDTSTSSYGDIDSGSYSTNTTPFVLTVGPGYTNQQLLATLTLTDAFGKTDSFLIDFTEDDPPLITGFDFTSSDREIVTIWTMDIPAPPHKGFHVYRSDEEFGIYEKMNDYLVTGIRLYSDLTVEPMSEYWYKISVVSGSGKERDLDDLQAYLAYTTLRRHEGFPIRPNASAARKAHSSPAVFDIDGDGTKELFVNYDNQYQNHIDEKGRIVGFYATGEELFDIDGNATEIWGFAATLRPLFSNPAIGDIDNDGHAEVFSTGRVNNPNTGILYGYRTVDNNSDQKPDLLWENTLDPGQINIGHRAMRNPVLADLDGDGYMEIIVMDEKQRIRVYDKDKNHLGSKQIGSTDYALGEVAVADIDNDGYKEIIIGCRLVSGNKGAIYVWDHDGNYTTDPVLLKEFGNNERADSGMVLADIDNDGLYEILTIVKNGTTGYVYALNVEDGSPVNNNWNGLTTIALSNGTNQEHIIPRMAVGDLNNDGNLEVVFGSINNLYAMDNQGNFLSGFPIYNVGNMWDNSPVLADVDDDDDIEIIVNAGGVLKAFKYDGSPVIGWNIVPDHGDGFVGTPFIGDIDNNGKNEVVISSDDATLYVWDTMGDSEKVEWGSYRANAQNTGVYREECTFYSGMSEEINFGSVLWDENKHIQGDLVIKSGSNLTIKSKITFTKKGKIVVEPGGKLILDGGILTAGCGGLWEGIQVLGNSSLSQIPANQGVLEIINEGTIKNAKTGISVGTNSIFMAQSGGHLKIDGAVFTDNSIAIKMFPYTYTNNSYVKNSLFETTSVDTEGVNKKVFISLQGINGLYVKDNTFITEEPVPHSSPALVSYWGKGIVATDSRINVQENHFENLYSAVQVQGTGIALLMSPSVINANSFENNWNAVYLNSMDGVKVTSNDINVFSAHVDGTGLESPSGLYINNANGFHIENNDFYKTTEEGTYSTGIFIRDCKATNLIYRNYFTGLFDAIHAYGQNTVPDDESIIIEGLRLVCNEFDSNEANAIYVAPNSSISNYQNGNNNYSAGNIFLPECSGNFTEFNNNSAQVYYFTENVPAKVPSCSQNVNIFYTLLSNECESTLPTIGTGLFAQIQDLEDEINDSKDLLDALTDGGDTQSLDTAIEEEEDALVLRDILLYESPFLSDTIMVKTALVEDALPSVMVKEILVANPKAAKSSKIQGALDNRSDQLPVYMREEIDLGKEILSEKEDLEKVLSTAIHHRENLIDRYIFELIEEATTASIDSIETILLAESLKKINRSYQLIDFYLSKGNYAAAQSVYNNIPVVFDLNNQQADEYSSFGQLFNIKYSVLSSGKSWQGIDSDQLEIIAFLAVDSTSVSGMQSRAILSLVNNEDYGFPIPLPVEPKNSNSQQGDLVPGTFKATPKIADKYFVIEYVLADKERVEEAEIIIYDNKNNPKKELQVISRANQFLVESEKWDEGIYLCKKMINGAVVSEENVLINRGGVFVPENEGDLMDAFFVLYPVPASDYFYIINSSSKEFDVQIANVSGILIDFFKINNDIKLIDTSDWSNGVYFVNFYSNGKMVDNQKILINK